MKNWTPAAAPCATAPPGNAQHIILPWQKIGNRAMPKRICLNGYIGALIMTFTRVHSPDRCEYWVREDKKSPATCWLKNHFMGFGHNGAPRRGSFRNASGHKCARPAGMAKVLNNQSGPSRIASDRYSG